MIPMENPRILLVIGGGIAVQRLGGTFAAELTIRNSVVAANLDFRLPVRQQWGRWALVLAGLVVGALLGGLAGWWLGRG